MKQLNQIKNKRKRDTVIEKETKEKSEGTHDLAANKLKGGYEGVKTHLERLKGCGRINLSAVEMNEEAQQIKAILTMYVHLEGKQTPTVPFPSLKLGGITTAFSRLTHTNSGVPLNDSQHVILQLKP